MTQQASFNPSEHLMQIKSSQGSKDYLPVQWRLVWLRSVAPQATITTELVHLDMDKECSSEVSIWNAEKRRSEKVTKTARGIAVFKATVTDGQGASATGYGSECAADFGDFIEKAETKSVGRALAMMGYGTQFVADELDEGHRIVDAPADVRTEPSQSRQNGRQDGIMLGQSNDLADRLKAVTERARTLGIDSNERWSAMLRYLEISKIKGEAEIALIEAYLTQEAEKREKTTF
jgi:hypothetical protein